MLFVFPPIGIFMLIARLLATAKSYTAPPQTGTAKTEPVKAKTVRFESVEPAEPAEPLKAAAKKPAQPQKRKRGVPKTPLEREQKNAKAVSGWLIFFAIIGLVTGVSCLSVGIPFIFLEEDIAAVLALTITGGTFLTGGIASLIGSRYLPRRVKLRRRYINLVADAQRIQVSALARSLGRSESRVRHELEDMLDDGYFGEGAYFDVGLDALIVDASAVRAAREAAEEAAAAPEIPISEYDRILRELKTLDEKIEDFSISTKIERIGATCAKIFEAVKDNPDKLPQLRRFMNYYLPTTLKLLRSYVTLEKQGIRGDNIGAAKDNIDRVLGTLAEGFDRQLDQLFRADVMDIGADIEVLENMMASDGLASESPFRNQTSTGEII
jgi:DNA-binding Lrp family transcriptional regulator